MSDISVPAKPAARSTTDLTRAAVSGWLGTAMEFMDFQLYSLVCSRRSCWCCCA